MRLWKPRCTLVAIAAGVFLIAGQAAPVQAVLAYDISFGAGAQMNDNLHLGPRTTVDEDADGAEALRQPVKETIYTINPGVTVSWVAQRDQLRLNYIGVYSIFQGDEERDSFWTHAMAADLSWRRWSPFFLEAREARSRVPRTQERDGEAWVDQVDRNLISVRTGLVWEISPRSDVELAYRGELNTFPGDETADRVLGHYGEALLRHRWSPLWGGEARVAYGQVDRKLTADSTELSVSAAVNQRWSEHLAARYRLEWLRNAEDELVVDGAAPGESGASVRSSLLKGAEISGDLAGSGSWNLAYQDNLDYLPDGDTLRTGRASGVAAIRARLGSTLEVGGRHETRDYRESGREEVAWGPTFGVRYIITPWAFLDLGGSWTSTTIRQEGLAEVEDRTTRVAAGLVFLLFNRIQLQVGYRYARNDSTDAPRSYTNSIVSAQATFHFRSVMPGGLPFFAASLW